jgi:hypothetical protein
MLTFDYSIEKYNFIKIVSDFFKVDPLENLHIFYSDIDKNFEWKEESSSIFHKMFYEKLSLGNSNEWKEIVDVYDSFVKNELNKHIFGDFVVQKFPSFRIQLPNSKAINKWHFDSDEDHRHPEGEINIQIPLTVMHDSSATWIESIPGMKNFTPINMFSGQYTIFNGNKCTHGNKVNKTGLTRLSFDFRVIGREKLESQQTKMSATTKTKFSVGGYYKEIF